MNRVFRILVDVILLAAVALTFGSGLVLSSSLDTSSAGGVSPPGHSPVWLNLHRLPALILVGALGFHVALSRSRSGTPSEDATRHAP